MRTLGMKWMVGALALSAFLAVSGASHASCTGDNRIAQASSGCMEGGHTNSCSGRIFGACVSWSSSFWAEAYSRCTGGTDKVVVKIDISGGSDRTWHLSDTNRREGTSSRSTNGVYCCNDLGRCY